MKRVLFTSAMWMGTCDSTLTPFIVKGQEATIGKYDYTVQLRVNLYDTSICGGTLISPTFVFTAAHCVDLPPDYGSVTYIVANNHENAPNPDSSTVYKVKRVLIHPDWNEDELINDFALIELYDEVLYKKHVILSSDGQYDTEGQMVSAHGWGKTDNDRESVASPVLKEDEYFVLEETSCLQKYKNAFLSEDPYFDVDNLILDKSWICLDSIDGESICNGDSGGPLIVNKEADQPVLLGAASFVIECGRKDYPFFFGRITEARDFIDFFATGHQWDDQEPPSKTHHHSNGSITSDISILVVLLLLPFLG